MQATFELKELDEWEYIYLLYNKEVYIILPNLRPDFILIRKVDYYEVGVEVTRLFFYNASARLKYMPNYIEKCIKRKYSSKG